MGEYTSLIISLLAAACFMLVSAGGCIQNQEAGAEAQPIRIAINVWPGYAHAFIAKKKGFFEKNGVNVEFVLKKDYTESTQLYSSGEVDGFFGVYPDVLLMSSETVPVKVVYISDFSETGDVIIGRPGIKSLADLKGKTIGIDSANIFSHIFVFEALKDAGLTEADVRFEVVPALDVPAALYEGRIDAGHTWEPAKSELLGNNYTALAYANDVPGVIMDVLTINPELIAKNPKAVQGIVNALLEAGTYLEREHDEGVRIMAEAENMSIEDMNSGLNGLMLMDLKQNSAAFTQSNETTSLYSTGADIIAFYLAHGQVMTAPKIGDVLEPKFVRSAKGGTAE